MQKLTRLQVLFLDFLRSVIDKAWNSQSIDTWRKNILKIADRVDLGLIKDMSDEDFSERMKWEMFCFALQDLDMYDLLVKIWPEEMKSAIPPKGQLSSIITFDSRDGKVSFVSKDEYIKRKLEGKDIIRFERLTPSGVPE